jgi:hypothetical protein
MASLDGLKIRKLLAQSKVVRVLDDKSVALRIVYSGASTSAPVISIITATSLTLTTSLGATVFTFGSGFGTLALLAAAINSGVGDGGLSGAGLGFSCRILDAIPSQITTASNLIVSAGLVAHSVNGEMVYDALLDHSTSKNVCYRISTDRNVVAKGPKGGHRVKLVDFIYDENVSAGQAGAVRVYEFNSVAGSTDLIWAALSVDATITEIDLSKNPLSSEEGGELIVMVMDDTSLTNDPANFLQVSFIRE